jgi:hypothetical protein
MRTLHSEQIGELAAALAQAQSRFAPIVKDQTAQVESPKGGYSYRYADLATVLDSIRGALAASGLALAQPIAQDEIGLTIRTELLHSSGQWIASEFPLVAPLDRPHVLGSAITYARRYSICALLGVAAEDDDGQAAEDHDGARAKFQERKAARNSSQGVSDPSPEYGKLVARWVEQINAKWKSTVTGKDGVSTPNDLLNVLHVANHLVKRALDCGALKGTSVSRFTRADGKRDYRMVNRFLGCWYDRQPTKLRKLVEEFCQGEFDKKCEALQVEGETSGAGEASFTSSGARSRGR